MSSLFKKMIAILSLSFFCLPLTSQTFGKSNLQKKEPAKYGVYSMQKIVFSVQEGVKAKEKLQAYMKEKMDELQTEKRHIDTLGKELKDQVALLSQEAQVRKQEELQQKILAFRNLEMKAEQDIKKREMEATQNIVLKVSGLVKVIAEQQKLELVFDQGVMMSSYIKDPVDLTDQLIKDYDQRYKAVAKSASK